MSKQSANRHKKQNQGSGKAANSATSTSPAQSAAKTNGTISTKPAETTTKLNGTTTKPAQAGARPSQPAAKAGTLKRAQQRKQQKMQGRHDQQREDAISRRNTNLTIATVVVLVGALIGYFVWHNLAPTDPLAQAQQIVDANYGPVDGVYCNTLEQLSYHIHAHITMYINGVDTPLVANTGIAPLGVTSTANVTCYYWLHTHDASGVIHIESPTTKLYTLSQFFDVWQQKFSSSTNPFPTELSSSAGWVIYVNGKQVNTDFNHLLLHAHDLITMGYNSPGIKPDTTYAWQGL